MKDVDLSEVTDLFQQIRDQNLFFLLSEQQQMTPQ